MVALILLCALIFLANLILNLRVTDPMWLGLNRAWYVWLSATICVLCVVALTAEIIGTGNTLCVFQDVSAKISYPEQEAPSRWESLVEAITWTMFGGLWNFYF